MHFGYSIVYVPDVAAALDFYHRAFEFTIRFASDEGTYGELDTGDTTIAFAAHGMAEHLGLELAFPRADAPGPGIELAFVTDDVAGAFARAVNEGATPVTDPTLVPWGQTVSYVRDLNGVVIEICTPVGG